MPREDRLAITPRTQENPQQGGRQVRAQVAASPIDSLPAYLPNVQDPTLQGLMEGLSSFSPAIKKKLQEEAEQNSERGALDRATGQGKQSTNSAYEDGYFHLDGIYDGQRDGAALQQKYASEFNKDGGDIEAFLQERMGEMTRGFKDGPYLKGYNKAIQPVFLDIRKQYLDYQKQAIETKLESNTMQLLDGGVRAYVTQSQPVPDTYLSGIKDYVGKNLGLAPERFDELLFHVVRKIGDEGHLDAYEMLKRDHPDGTPGLYFNPKWKHQIEQAEAHSYNALQERSQKERDQKQNEAMYPVFAEEDPKKAQAMFQELKKSGLFSRADDLIKWDRLMTEKVDGKPNVRQLETEGLLLAKVYQGGLSFKDVLNSNASGDITASQRKYLLSEIRRVQTENRTLAAQAGKAEEAIYKTTEFRSGEDFLQTMLKPRPKDNMDLFSTGTDFDRAQLAQARLEFTKAAKGKQPGELQPLLEDITKRYMKRRSDYTAEQQAAVGANQIPFKSLKEAQDAARKGLLSPAEFRSYINYFKGQQ